MKKLTYLFAMIPAQAMAGGLSASSDSDMFILLKGAVLLAVVFYLGGKFNEWRKPNPDIEEFDDINSNKD